MRHAGIVAAPAGSCQEFKAKRAWECRLLRPRRPLAWRGYPSQTSPCWAASSRREYSCGTVSAILRLGDERLCVCRAPFPPRHNGCPSCPIPHAHHGGPPSQDGVTRPTAWAQPRRHWQRATSSARALKKDSTAAAPRSLCGLWQHATPSAEGGQHRRHTAGP